MGGLWLLPGLPPHWAFWGLPGTGQRADSSPFPEGICSWTPLLKSVPLTGHPCLTSEADASGVQDKVWVVSPKLLDPSPPARGLRM